VRGTMDLLMTTTIPTWKIVWGKWWCVPRAIASKHHADYSGGC